MHDTTRAGVVDHGGQRRRRRHQHEWHVGSPTPLDHHVACVPGRRALVLVRLVVFVEQHRRCEIGAGRPGGRTRADHDVDTARRHRPVVGHDGDRHTRSAKSRGEQRHHVSLGSDDERRAETDRGEQRRHHVDTRRQTQHSPAAREEVTRRRRDGCGRHAGTAIRRQADHRTTRRRRDQERADPPGRPADRCPLGQFEQLRRRPVAGDLGDRLQRLDRAAVGWFVRDRRHPATDPAPVEFDPHDRAHAHARTDRAGSGSRTACRAR